MKKLLVLCLVLAVYQKWHVIDEYFNPPPDYSAMEGVKVILYATSWCGYCIKTREFLSNNRVPYKEYDIEKSQEGRRQYNSLKGNGVPVLLINGEVIHGYNPSQMSKLLSET